MWGLVGLGTFWNCYVLWHFTTSWNSYVMKLVQGLLRYWRFVVFVQRPFKFTSTLESTLYITCNVPLKYFMSRTWSVCLFCNELYLICTMWIHSSDSPSSLMDRSYFFSLFWGGGGWECNGHRLLLCSVAIFADFSETFGFEPREPESISFMQDVDFWQKKYLKITGGWILTVPFMMGVITVPHVWWLPVHFIS